MARNKNIDKVFEDMLDDDFTNVFKPILYILKIFGTLGIQLKYKFITPPTTQYKAYSIFYWSVSLICVTYSASFCSTRFDSLSTDIPLKIGVVVNSFLNTWIAWKSAIYSDQSKSQLYVKLQKIDRTLRMKDAKRLNHRHYWISLLRVFFIVFFLTVWLIIFNKYMMRDFCACASVASVASTTSYFIIVHVSTIFVFLSERVSYINNALVKVKACSQARITYATQTARTEDKIGDDLVYGMCYILESFADMMDVFQHTIFLFTLQMLIWQLLSMQNLVISFKSQMTVDLPSFLCTVPSSTVFMYLMVSICLRSQTFSTGLETSSEICTSIISSLHDGETRRNAKRLRILLNGRRHPTVYDVFTLNTRLPFNLLAFTASYTIVLLQFATL